MANSPFDIAKIINTKSEYLLVDKDYKPFMMNKIFSNTQDTVMFANEANKFTKNITPQMNFDWYYYGLSKKSRFGKYHKQQKIADSELVDYVKDYFNFSTKKALDAIECFDDETIKAIKDDIKKLKQSSLKK